MRKLILLLLCSALFAAAKDAEYFVYFGTFTGANTTSKGIYAYRYNPRTVALTSVGLVAEMERPSWVLQNPDGKSLYAVSEVGTASVSSFAIDPKTGALQFRNKVSSDGGGACHLAIDKTDKAIAVANYGTGSTTVFRLNADGSIGEQGGHVQDAGSSANAKRQTGPHAHAVVFSPDNRFLFVPNLGTDQIDSFRFDPTAASITPNEPYGKVSPGSGPRHFAFHPSGKFAYVINEMGSRVTAFAYDAEHGTLRELQNTSTLPEGFQGEDNSAEIVINPSGKHLYASNRGDDSITVFAIKSKTGELTKIQHVPTQGRTPRAFKIDPTGKYLFAANQDSNNFLIFSIHPRTGQLTPTGKVFEVPSPVAIEFVAVP